LNLKNILNFIFIIKWKFLTLLLVLLSIVGLVNAACNGAHAQCDGVNFKGENCCVSGYTCKKLDQWYSQCVPDATDNNAAKNNDVNNASKNNVPMDNSPKSVNNNNAGANKIGTIYIAGDSTADNNGANNSKTAGWGKYLGDYFSVPVNNQAKSGQSARTFWRDGRWNALIKNVRKGDYVLIEFGHNDTGGPNTVAKKGSVVGTGNETVKVGNEIVHTFPWYIRQMAKQVLDKGATPVLMSNTPNFSFNKGKVPASGRFGGYMKLVAEEMKIPFIDHYNYIARQWEKLGEIGIKSKNWFPTDYKHTAPGAADFNAQMIVNAAKCQNIKDLVSALNTKGNQVKYSCSV